MDRSKKIFIRNNIIEELEDSHKGELDSSLKLKLENGLIYQLTPSVKIKEKLSGTSEKNLSGTIITHEELAKNNYDIYMDTVIIDEDTVYTLEEGFTGTIIRPDAENNTTKPDIITKEEIETKISVSPKEKKAPKEDKNPIRDEIEKSFKEHKELKEIIKSFEHNISETSCSCYNLYFLLELSLKNINKHTKREKKFLNTVSKNNLNLEIIIKRYLKKIDSTSNYLKKYHDKWYNNVSMKTRDIFLKETKEFIKLFNHEIHKEEDILYDLLIKKLL